MVRFYQENLFYDPLLEFFKTDFLQVSSLPSLQLGKLLLSLTFRFILNSFISLLILFVLFRDLGIVKFAGILFIFFYAVLLAAFIILIENYHSDNYMALFYVRRFLIQPIFILILIPAFYYYKRSDN
tara:strand:- start:117 stop:497 length:381 start_codon:yes stop_codon:yes gene_type:complete